MNSYTSESLVQHWTVVTDSEGSSHLVAHWRCAEEPSGAAAA
jgi:hypothetical protein